MKKLLLAFWILFAFAFVYSEISAQCFVNITGTQTSCSGMTNGQATATVYSGTGPYAYTWSTTPVQITQVASGLAAGSYTVSILDSKGCSATNSVTVNQPFPLSVSITRQNVKCNGAGNGTLLANPLGGTSPYHYNWSTVPVKTTAGINGLSPGIYSLTLTDANGCSVMTQDTITQPAIAVLSTASVQASCKGSSGSASVKVVSGGTSPFNYTWSTGVTGSTGTGVTISLSNLLAGNYSVTLTDANACTSVAGMQVGNSSGLVVSISSTNVTCYQAGNGTAGANPSGGIPPFTYAWSTGSTSSTLSNLVIGSYSVTVTDASQCVFSSPVLITRPAQLNETLSGTNLSCFGTASGTITSAVSGGTLPYAYSWSPAGGSGSVISGTQYLVSGLSAATYTVKVTDAHGCTATSTQTLTQPGSAPALSFTSFNVSCNGGSNGAAIAHATGGTTAYTYAWSTVPVQTLAFANNLSAGTYSLTLTDHNGCTVVNSVIITQPVLPVSLSLSAVKTGCSVPDGSAAVTAGGGSTPYVYAWSNGSNAATNTGLGAGTYTVTVTDAKFCSASSTVLVGDSGGFSAVVTAAAVSCNGGSNGTAGVSVGGGSSLYTYSWSNGVSGVTVSTALNQITGLAKGVYSVSVIDSAGCSYTASGAVSQPAALSAGIVKLNPSCKGALNGSLSLNLSGGTVPYVFAWSNGIGSGSGGASGATGLASGLGAGNYTLTLTDANACTALAFSTLTEPAAIGGTSANVNISCYGGNNGVGLITPSGGNAPYSYAWAPGLTGATAQVLGSQFELSGLTSGIYTVTVSDKNGCTGLVTDTLKQPAAALHLGLSETNSSCGNANGSLSISPSGGSSPYTYFWSTGMTTAALSNLAAGSYAVTVNDSKGCLDSLLAAVNNLNGPAIVIDSMHNVKCMGLSDGSVYAAASGGTGKINYAWSNGILDSTMVGLTAGTYTLTVTDANNCSAYSAVVVTQPAALGILMSEIGPSCHNIHNGSATALVTGGTQAYSYYWSNGNGIQSAGGLAAGTYTVTVTDANGCTLTSTASIVQPTAVSMSSGIVTNALCYGSSTGSVSETVSGGTPGYVYAWSNGSTGMTGLPVGGSGLLLSGLAAGSYTLTVSDLNSCTVTAPVLIGQPVKLTAVAGSTMALCNGQKNGTAWVTANGGMGPYNYIWNTVPVQNSMTASGLGAGNYLVSVIDNNGCLLVVQDTVKQPAVLKVSGFTVSEPLCHGQLNGSASASVSGGTLGYTYSWFTGGGTGVGFGTSSISGLDAGTYSLTVTDKNGCTADSSLVLDEPLVLSAAINKTNVNCFGGSSGAAAITAAGGTGNYTYSWSTGASAITTSGFVVSGLAAGIYTLTLNDANACSIVMKDTVTQSAALGLGLSSANTVCGGSTGTVTAVTSGGRVSYSYSWMPAGGTGLTVSASTYKVQGLGAGTYTVTVMDSLGCSKTAVVALSSSTPGTLTVMEKDVNCYGLSTGLAWAVVSGGNSPYVYSWSSIPVQSKDTAGGLPAGNYSVAVTDKNGCTVFGSVTVGEPSSALSFTKSRTNASCVSCKDGSGTVIPAGGTGPYTYSWNTIPLQTTANATGLAGGIYSVCVTDVRGCSVCDTLLIPVNVATGILSGNTVGGGLLVTVYPNPASEILNLELSAGVRQKVVVRLSNLLGQVLFTEIHEAVDLLKEGIDLSACVNGIYVLEVQTMQGTMSRRVVVEK